MADMQVALVSLLLADISGYTRFVTLHGASILHAEEIVTQLMEAVIRAATPPLVLNKLEGDAAFLYARVETGQAPGGEAVVRQTPALFEAFRLKQQALIKEGEGGCFCDACCNIGELKLKVILHQGQAVVKRVQDLEELAGRDVILAHRLLKNQVPAKEYILMTQSFFLAAGGIPDRTPFPIREAYEDLGEVEAVVFFLESPAPELPATRRFTRPGGIARGLGLFFRPLWRRLTGRSIAFHNLPR